MGRSPFLDDPEFDPLADEFDHVDGAPGGKKASQHLRRGGADDEFAKLLAGEGEKSFVRLKVGDEVEAKIVQVGESSVFLDIGQRAEGSVELVEFSPEERAVLAPGMKLRLYVAAVQGGAVELTKSLGARQLSREKLETAMAAGLPVMGKVVAENKGGYTVEIAGVTGFVPYSQIDVGPRKPATEYIGKQFEFRVTRLEARNTVLSRAAILREQHEAAQAEMLENLKVGAIVQGAVVRVEKFGAFVDIGSGLTVLIPNSEMSWSRVSGPSALTSGERVSAKVIRMEVEGGRPRIAASIKQLDGDPWERLAGGFAVGQTVQGTVTKLMQFGAFVELAPGLEGLVHISEMSAKRRIHQPGEVVAPGQEVTVKILGIDSEMKRIGLSLRALESEVLDAETKAKYLKTQTNDEEHRGVELVTTGGGATFADALRRAEEKRKREKA